MSAAARQDYVEQAARVVEKIDKVSRTRPLSDDESKVLEHFIGVVDGKVPWTQRLPFRTNIVLARIGIRRVRTADDEPRLEAINPERDRLREARLCTICFKWACDRHSAEQQERGAP